ncbi:hypothetical protein [Thalassobellus citreus]|uniref:hypothetical protein n=1 Tax=Thalassobellus citreus TaxID=3367752 RepID=UPI00379870BE
MVLKDYKINPDKKVLIFGDSHAETCFYDKENDIQNFGVRSEVPNLTYLKVSYLFQKASNKEILLTISPHNISEWHEKRFFKKDSTGATLSKYWVVLNNLNLLKDYNNLPFNTQLVLHIKKLFGAPNIESNFKYKETFKGGFYKGRDTSIINLTEAKGVHLRHYGNELNMDIAQNKSDKLINYYYDLIELFLSKKCSLTIIGTPLHANYRHLMSSDQLKNYKDYLNQLKLKYPSIRIFDYSNLKLEDKYYLNSDHLNLKGAKLFTSIVLKDIKNE